MVVNLRAWFKQVAKAENVGPPPGYAAGGTTILNGNFS